MLSTRAFGRLPRPADLELARRFRFLDLEFWMDDLLEDRAIDVRSLSRILHDHGLNVPCVHLPVRHAGGVLDFSDGELIQREEALDHLRYALDVAAQLHPRVVIAHARGVASDGLGRLLETAEEHGLRIALENDTLPDSSLDRLVRALGQLGSVSRGHGVCVDLSRVMLDRDGFHALGNRLLWLEISKARDLDLHTLPADDDRQMRCALEYSQLPQGAYEIVPIGPVGVPPGDAQLTMLLRRIAAWHVGAGQPLYQGASPFLPIG